MFLSIKKKKNFKSHADFFRELMSECFEMFDYAMDCGPDIRGLSGKFININQKKKKKRKKEKEKRNLSRVMVPLSISKYSTWGLTYFSQRPFYFLKQCINHYFGIVALSFNLIHGDCEKSEILGS